MNPITLPSRPRSLAGLASLAAVLILAVLALQTAAWAQGDAATPPPTVPVPTEADTDTRLSFLELLLEGGWFMVPIALCSLLGVAVIIERLIALRRRAIIPPKFLSGLKGAFRGPQDREEAVHYCRRDGSPIARVIAVGIRKMPQGVEAVEQGIEDAGANEVSKLRRNLRILYGVSAIAPMLGLLGTVWGMIEAFQEVQGGSLGKADRLAGGIYIALVTTFAGLCVAIPLLVFYYYFLSKIDRIVSDMNDTSEEFVEHYLSESEVATAPPVRTTKPTPPAGGVGAPVAAVPA